MNLTLKDDASQAFKVALTDKFGDATVATGGLTVTSSDESIVTASLSADGSILTIDAAGAGKLGTATVQVASSADNLAAQVDVTVVSGDVAQIVLTPITPAIAPATEAAPAADAVAAPADAAPSSTEPVAAVPGAEAAPAA
ncbi:hypothetical protein [Burkholderia anthina]|uniref:hypothetical protein n=1 Tax=Burkholderia anthina TaxID=179879 RepID=UPI00158DC14E|nr:hypothetical protein [Burkholderia anthina]